MLRLSTIALAAAAVSGFEMTFTNKCSYTINLKAAFGRYVCDIAPGAANTCTQYIGAGQQGLFKHTEKDDVNLVEYSTINSNGMNFVWYDVSNIPPMPGNCNSYQNCKDVTGKSGFNVPVYVTPTTNAGQGSCTELRVTKADSGDAYLFPADNTKTHACPMDTKFSVTFCPEGGSGGNPSASFQKYDNTDFWGNDIGRFQVWGDANAKASACASGCKGNDQCVGFSVSGDFCYMKNAIANKFGSGGVIGGIMNGNGKCAATQWNTDFYGNDIDRKQVWGNAGERSGQCCNYCNGVGNCAAYTVNGDWCYLKSQVGSASWSGSAYSGRRASA
ncbi:hypothetical protein SDRG_11617 [Saprolegnia diclina VS20]|uniref:Apple domain-containing protein n=1 Tax=Saprolegnia diclina (strain VS20) TaxID=1156394 RepID=T0RE59_SAPDV|nr:hypothetical protein SDRG_11617 [Saprolegnia diclina VS20]EQC30558.1 hypothetical protein SDRG_11617 [Saprolegnia diclina VS20]|eukprot:XP_008615884.1 hypothetical protein SDRG_11617 [Saprolegnia diclina VS20]